MTASSGAAASLSFVKEPACSVAHRTRLACSCIVASYLSGYLNGPFFLKGNRFDVQFWMVRVGGELCIHTSQASPNCTQGTMLELIECILWGNGVYAD